MNREAFLHDLDLGRPLEVAEIERIVREEKKNPLLTAIMQHLRNASAAAERLGRQPLVGASPDFRAYHAGAADALEEVVWLLKSCTESG